MAKRAAGAAAASTRLSANTAAAAVAATAGAVALVWLRGQKVGCPCGLSWPTEVTPAASSFEYGGGCDFEVVDEMPSQQEFDARFWNRAPLLVRNGTRDWPARTRWTKEALWRRSQRERHSAGYFRTDDHWASYTSVGNRSMRAERGDVDMAEFLCHGVCQPPVQTDQVYLFDRDDWRTGLPGLDEDVQFPSTIARHFDAAWHERWSLYFLISALGSGINFHQHTNAFNGLLFGRKRWFLYPDGHAPPSFKLGMLAWFRDVYRAEWGGSVQWEGTPRRATRGLLQCMQAAGDLIYIPQQMWHATIALGPGVGVSGQFVRKAHALLAEATELARKDRWDDAAVIYELAIRHRDELEPGVAVAVAENLAVARFNAGRRAEAAEAAQLAMQVAHEAGGRPSAKAELVLRQLA